MSARRAAEFAAFAAAIAQASQARGPEALVGHGIGAAAAARALTQGLAVDRVVLLDSGTLLEPDDVVDSLADRESPRLAA